MFCSKCGTKLPNEVAFCTNCGSSITKNEIKTESDVTVSETSLPKTLLKPNDNRAKNTITWIYIVLALEIVALISSLFQYSMLQVIASGNYVSEEATNANDIREGIIAFAYLIAWIVSAIVFIKWFRQAYFNLHKKVSNLSYTEGWAIASWFVPILCLYRPYRIMNDLYVETKKLLMKKGVLNEESITTHSLSLWWTLWIISTFIGNALFRHSLKAETTEQLINNTIGYIISYIIDIPLCLITIKVIKDYSKVEPLLLNIADEENKELVKEA